MAREGLSLSLCAGVLLGVLCLVTTADATAGDDKESAIANTLAVQTALQQGRDLLLKSNYKAAVYVLESQISRIDGNREYLQVLRDAYRGYVRELKLANQEAEAGTYLTRLQMLDPGAVMDFTQRPAGQPVTKQTKPTQEPANPSPPKEDNPFSEFNARQAKAKALIERGEQEFANRRYDEGARFFELAHQIDPNSTTGCLDRWAYCKLYQVVQQLNQPPAKGVSLPELEKEARLAMSLAPQLDNFGQEVLRKIAEQRGGVGDPAKGAAAISVAVRHKETTPEGWYLAETTNFRIFHRQNRTVAEKVAEVAERTRVEMARKWLGETEQPWNARCDIYLHATAQDYSKATGVPTNSPGHSTFRTERGGRVMERRIDLHLDDPNTITAVLPHEATHVVLAGKFGEQPVPRWVDEGVAVLSEPRDKIERHLSKLPQFRQDRQLFSAKQLMQLNEYPEPRYIAAFYGQSVSLVEFLAGEKGPETFIRFVREGMRTGYEPALKRYYGYQDFNDLDQNWRRYAFKEGAVPTGVAERIR